MNTHGVPTRCHYCGGISKHQGEIFFQEEEDKKKVKKSKKLVVQSQRYCSDGDMNQTPVFMPTPSPSGVTIKVLPLKHSLPPKPTPILNRCAGTPHILTQKMPSMRLPSRGRK
jgi:hypothetical protein